MVLLLLAFFYFGYYEKNDGSFSLNNQNKICFTRNTEDGGSANIVMTVSKSAVHGRFDFNPAEENPKSGYFSGVIKENSDGTQMIEAFWHLSSKGTTSVEELQILIGEGIASPGMGEKEYKGGIYLYANPISVSFGPNLSLVDCETETVDY